VEGTKELLGKELRSKLGFSLGVLLKLSDGKELGLLLGDTLGNTLGWALGEI